MAEANISTTSLPNPFEPFDLIILSFAIILFLTAYLILIYIIESSDYDQEVQNDDEYYTPRTTSRRVAKRRVRRRSARSSGNWRRGEGGIDEVGTPSAVLYGTFEGGRCGRVVGGPDARYDGDDEGSDF